jgi:hypothetical protein
MEIQNLRGQDVSCIAGKGEEERKRIKKIKKIISYTFKGLQLPFQLWAIVYCGSAKALLMDISDESCSNTDTNAVLIYIAATLTKTYTSTCTAIAVLSASLLLDIILDVLAKRKAKKEAENKKSVSVSPNKDEHIQLAHIEDSQAISPIKYGQTSPVKPASQSQPQQIQPQQVQPQQGPTIVIQLQPGQMGAPQQFPPQQQQQFPPQQQQQFPPQQFPPQQFPPQQFPQQQFPPQQFAQPGFAQQYPPQQQFPQQGYPQQQYPPRY